ncbi:hypothetical protein AB0K60_36240 [Thermopolyspora sp. NPDC052614]|uniref:hypothetical protein n=1 Tax=Thermopolyspora sp. NPDC052614 TaxID=3155682 RepID=UPI0034242D75
MSQAQRRLALMAAALGTFGAGALLLNLPAGADTKTVSYTCTSGSGTSTTHQVTVNLTGNASATAGTAYTATLVIGNASPAFNAAEAIPTGSIIQIIPQVSISATPVQPAVREVLPTGSASVNAALQPNAALAPIPTATVTVTPPTGATSLALSARGFTLRVAQAGAAAGAELYSCQIATTGSTAPAAVTAAVSGTSSTSPSPSNTTTTASTSPTPQGTKTVEVTVTADEPKDSKVEKTPNGGAATGGGGEAGPDGRMFVLTGTIMVLGAAAGGLALRRRRLARG